MFFKLIILPGKESCLCYVSSPFHYQDLITHSPYYKQYNWYGVSLENLVLDQLIIPKLMFLFFLITFLFDLHWYCKEKISLGYS